MSIILHEICRIAFLILSNLHKVMPACQFFPIYYTADTIDHTLPTWRNLSRNPRKHIDETAIIYDTFKIAFVRGENSKSVKTTAIVRLENHIRKTGKPALESLR